MTNEDGQLSRSHPTLHSALHSAPQLALQEALAFHFSKPELLELALTHKSFANEQVSSAGERPGDNERLEFLGDAVLDLAVSEILMSRFASDPEGSLSKKRASLVNEDTLAQIAGELGLGLMIQLGKGETKTGGLQKPRILSSTLEAILGAIQLDGGYAAASQVVARLFAGRMETLGQNNVDFQSDFKTRLQERAQEIYKTTPTYRVDEERGPDHDKQFLVSVIIAGETFASGLGRSKKAAEQNAAQHALETISKENVCQIVL